MSQSKKDEAIVAVVFFGYIASSIVFTIWNWENIENYVVLVFWGHLGCAYLIGYICKSIANNYEINSDDLPSEINLDFEGNLGRANFWIIFLGLFLFVDVFLVALDVIIFGWDPSYDYSDWLSYSMIATYFTLLPTLAIGARRLHDSGRSGWWQLLYLTIIGIVVLIIFWAQETKQEKNNAKASFDSDSFAKEIERLSELKNKGAITEEEYSKAKSKILT